MTVSVDPASRAMIPAPEAVSLVRLATLPAVLSSLSYAILAVLATKPQTGYDIARNMKPPLGFLWQARHGQIYPELARLVNWGLVDFERLDPKSGPPRHVHAITPSGRAELSKWVLMAPQPRPMNDEFVVKAYALRRVRKEEALKLLREQIDEHEKRLGVLEQLAVAMRSRDSQAPGADSVRFGEYAALRRGIGAEREYLSWSRWLLDELTPAQTPTKRATRSPAKRPVARRAR